MFLRQALDLIVVDLAGGGIQSVLHSIVKLAGEIHLGAMRQVPAIGEAHAKDGIARVA